MFDDDVIDKLNHDGDCLAYDYVKANLKDKNKSGTWAVWKYVLMLNIIRNEKGLQIDYL
ncbi:MAG: hypothetical protein RBQ97_03315 [Acholeplasma sp.]|nr:hypothetical protein [Acholeplasma sp.]